MSNAPEDPKTEVKQKLKPGSVPTPKMKRGFKGFIADTSREMKKVNWPSKKETSRLTFVVLAIVIGVAVTLGLMGWASGTIVALITKGRAS